MQRGRYDNLASKGTLDKYIKDTGVKLLRPEWLFTLAECGGILPRNQDIPPCAFFPVSEYERYNHGGVLLVVSHPWWSETHPDPAGIKLKQICSWLKQKNGLYRAVFIDFGCLPQKPYNSDEECACFKKALKNINVLYAHDHTHVLKLDDEIPSIAANRRAYGERGWCEFERRVADMKTRKYVDSIQAVEGEAIPGVDGFLTPGTAPLSPDGFCRLLQSLTFTNSSDKGTVAGNYAKVFSTKVACTESVDWENLPAMELPVLGESMPHFVKLKKMTVSYCASEMDCLNDEILAPVTAALPKMKQLKSLTLQHIRVRPRPQDLSNLIAVCNDNNIDLISLAVDPMGACFSGEPPEMSLVELQRNPQYYAHAIAAAQKAQKAQRRKLMYDTPEDFNKCQCAVQ